MDFMFLVVLSIELTIFALLWEHFFGNREGHEKVLALIQLSYLALAAYFEDSICICLARRR